MIFDWSTTAALAAVQNTAAGSPSHPERRRTVGLSGLQRPPAPLPYHAIGPHAAGGQCPDPAAPDRPRRAPHPEPFALDPDPRAGRHLPPALRYSSPGRRRCSFWPGCTELPFLARGEILPGRCRADGPALPPRQTTRPTAGPAANWPLPCCVSFPGPTAPPPPCPRWCRRPWRTSAQTTRAFTAWRS